ncbi:MAG: hypothetical protein ACU833_03195 [Gammaproteobacteria bacterium]
MRELILFFFALNLLGGCATTGIGPQDARNSVSTEKLSTYDPVFMKHASLAPAYRDSSANLAALKKIDENLFKEMHALFPNLAEYPSDASIAVTAGNALIIEPYVEKIKFIGGAARFWAGALAGSSAVILKMTYRDQATGKVLCDPSFFQRASAMGGAWTFGAHDNSMLFRIAQVAADHARENY